jgi:DNA polymerase-3 subunit gamma/tau
MNDYIETGDSDMLMNVKEIDVTDDSGKQAIGELLEDASIPAYDSSWKVYILDECHMMTNAAQNRLLKNLEEPAERVLMILCTTDPQKLLETIISRCQYVFPVTKPSRDELANLLARVCKAEGVAFEPKALSLVCVKGDFVPRKTLVALEQVVREKQDVTYDNTIEVLNIVAEKYFFDFYTILLAENIDIFKYITFIGGLKTTMDLKQYIENLITFTMRGIYINNGVVVEALDKSEITQYKKLFSSFSVGDVAHLLNLLLDMKSSLDVEAKLMLLGYTGLKRQHISNVSNDLTLVDTSNITASMEKKEGDANYISSITMTEDEKTSFIDKHKQTVTGDMLADMFQGTVIDLTEK